MCLHARAFVFKRVDLEERPSTQAVAENKCGQVDGDMAERREFCQRRFPLYATLSKIHTAICALIELCLLF
jgi:hypothetical protein